MKNFNIVLFIICLVSIVSCMEDDRTSEDFGTYQFIPSEYNIEFPESKDEHFIGRIRDITTDKAGNIYVLDSGALNVKKFNLDGQLTNTFGLGRGRGPGELNNPVSVAVDSSDNVYIADMANNNINVYSPHNDVISQFSTGFMPARMVVDGEKNLFLIGFSLNGQSEIIHKYKLNNENDYEKTISFGKKPENIDNNLLSRAGNVDALGLDSGGNLYLSLWYPYEIRKYTLYGDLLSSFSRDVPFFKEPSLDSRGIVDFTSGSWGILPISEDIVVNQIFYENGDERKYYYDLVDLTAAEHIGFISEAESDLPPDGGLLATDRAQNIYIGSNSPEPNIFKFKLQKNE